MGRTEIQKRSCQLVISSHCKFRVEHGLWNFAAEDTDITSSSGAKPVLTFCIIRQNMEVPAMCHTTTEQRLDEIKIQAAAQKSDSSLTD